jgi:hypothetical protein
LDWSRAKRRVVASPAATGLGLLLLMLLFTEAAAVALFPLGLSVASRTIPQRQNWKNWPSYPSWAKK